MHTSRFLIAFGALAISGWAQPSAGVAGPVTGFIFDAQSGAVRPMLGIPGAAYLGNGVAIGLDAASVAPDGSAALAVERGGKLMLYTGLRNAHPAALAVAGAIPSPDRFVWAADGSAAAVYSSRAGQAQILTGLAQSPVAAAPINLSSLPGQVTALAFDGLRLIVAVASPDGHPAHRARRQPVRDRPGGQQFVLLRQPIAADLPGARLRRHARRGGVRKRQRHQLAGRAAGFRRRAALVRGQRGQPQAGGIRHPVARACREPRP
jgi:hypothetical protein